MNTNISIQMRIMNMNINFNKVTIKIFLREHDGQSF